MTPEQWRQARDLFEAGLDLEPGELRHFLAQQSADAAVIAEVQSLLEHNTRAGQFLDAPLSERAADLFDETPQFEPGTRLGVYEIHREIGRGGMGRIYLATDTRLGRTVALKALPPSVVDDPGQRERLRREARAAAQLTHPGICTVYALEEIGDAVFIAAEYIDGQSLREEIGRGPRPSPERVRATARELAEALASAHARGITHRDLKPENVMRTADGRLKILDFGLALSDPGHPAAIDYSSPRVTQPGAIIGTPAYMAPEQIDGGHADSRSDVFALGVLIYEYATGTHPFQSSTALALAARILDSDPPRLETVRADLPASVTATVMRALAKKPADRFASAIEFSAALADAPVERARASADVPVSLWWRNHQIIAIALYLVAGAVAWRCKEWLHGWPDTMFLLVGIAATAGGVFRGHLLFTERMNRAAFDAERRRAVPATMIVDTVMAAALAVDGYLLSAVRPLAGVLTIALAVGIALTRMVVEPSTTSGAFGER